jgi:glutamate dehydrogenase (NAD(P)+)
VTVSYFEQVQNAYGYYWDEKMVNERLDGKMTAAFHAVSRRFAEIQGEAAGGGLYRGRRQGGGSCRLRGWI